MFTQLNNSGQGGGHRIAMQSTKDYGKFRMMLGNRPVNQTTLTRVMSEIRNQGQIVPILCNEKHEVTDGQHRLEACKQLGFPVKYIVIPGLTIKDAAAANSAGKNWSVRDWVHYHAEMGNEDYKKLRDWIDYCDYHGVRVSSAIQLARLSSTQNSYSHFSDGIIRETSSKIKNVKRLGHAGSDVRLGYWKTKDYEKSMALLNDVLIFKDYSFYRNPNFISALITSNRQDNFDAKILLSQAKKYPQKFYHCGKTSDYLAMFEDVYNFNRHKANRLYLRVI